MAALAGVPDALSHVLCQPGDSLAIHALHYNEQDLSISSAYTDERELLGAAPHQVIEVTRPRRQNVVYIDRFHLIASGASPHIGGQLLGLYVGGRGTITIYALPPQLAGTGAAVVTELPNSNGSRWAEGGFAGAARFTVHYTKDDPYKVSAYAPIPFLQSAAAALDELSRQAEHWG